MFQDLEASQAQVLGGVRALTERRLAGADAAAALKVSRHVSESHARQSGALADCVSRDCWSIAAVYPSHE